MEVAVADERVVGRRVATRAAQGLPGVSPDAFGAGVGRALEQAGQVAHSEAIETHRIERRVRDNSEFSQFSVAFATAREEFSEAAREGRKSDEPGHAKRLGEQWDKREGELLGMLSSPQMQERGRQTLANWGAGFRDRETAWEDLRQAEVAVERYSDQLTVSANRARRLESPADYASEVGIQMDTIDALEIDDKAREKLRDNAETQLAVGFLRGMTDRDPEATKVLIASGEFDGVLSGDQVEGLLNGADVEIRRAQAELARENAEIRAQLRERVQTFKEAESQGLIEEPEAFDGAIAQATALGDTSLALELEGLKVNSAFTKIWGPENASAFQREQRLTELAAMDSRTAAQNRELAFLREHSGAWASQEASDPVGLAGRRGGAGAPPPIDLSDPATLGARAEWAAARGLPPLSKVEVQTLRRTYENGRGGEEQVMAVIGSFPPAQAMAAASMLDPSDRTLPVVATLDPDTRSLARRGREALKANRTLISDRLKDDLDLADFVADQREEFEAALSNVPPDQRAAVREAADQIVAGFADGGFEPDAEAFERSLSQALGASFDGGEQRGGLDRWRGKMFLLPGGWSKSEFKAQVLLRARTNILPPVNPDGSPANLLRADPVPVAPGVYEFHTAPGSPLLTKEGGAWRVRVDAR